MLYLPTVHLRDVQLFRLSAAFSLPSSPSSPRAILYVWYIRVMDFEIGGGGTYTLFTYGTST